jgi:acetylornithine deacetylase/succinyl-diaminopimelate desuccinylase-like protein
MRAMGTGVCGLATASVLLLCGMNLMAQNATALPEQDRALAHDIFKQLIETNTQDSNGSVTAAAEKMRQRLLDAGFAAQDLVLAGPNDRKQNLVAIYRGKPGSTLKPILTICHLDVVEARKADWTTDPYQFVEKDGFFYGRGTQDIKEEDAALVETFIRMKREGYVPDRDLAIALTADEEGGASNGVDWLLKNRPELMKADFVINPDAGGLELKDGRAVEIQVEATEKLYSDYQVMATNPGGHSSQPRPDNAIYELVHALAKLEASPFPVELNAVTREELEAKEKIAARSDPGRAAMIRGVLANNPKAVAEFSQDATDNATLRTTCVATMVTAGHAPNALPGMAKANVNCRILPGHSKEEIRDRLISIFDDPKLKVDYLDSAGVVEETATRDKSMEAPPVRKDVFGPLHEVVERMWPGVPVVPVMSTGASDSIYTMGAGIPSYGISGMGVDFNDDRAHGRDERIRVEAFYQGVEFRYLYMKALSE